MNPRLLPPGLALACALLLVPLLGGCGGDPECTPELFYTIGETTDGVVAWKIDETGDEDLELDGSEEGGGCFVDVGAPRPQSQGIDVTAAIACTTDDGLAGAFIHFGDPREWSVGERTLTGEELGLALVADRACRSPDEYCGMCVAYLDDVEVRLVVEEAVGGADASRPTGVTDDYKRVFLVEFEGGPVRGHRYPEDNCGMQSMKASVRWVQDASHFTQGTVCR
jgi:hypothetical protein